MLTDGLAGWLAVCAGAVSELNSAVAEVSGPYTLLEYHFMRASVSKALAIDEAPRLNKAEGGWADGRTSSCVDDSFYVIRRCAKRALMTGRQPGIHTRIGVAGLQCTGGMMTRGACCCWPPVCGGGAGHAGTASAIVNYVNR